MFLAACTLGLAVGPNSRNAVRLLLLVAGSLVLVLVGLLARHCQAPPHPRRALSADAYLHVVQSAATAARDFLLWMDGAVERLAPERSVELTNEAQRLHGAALGTARAMLAESSPPQALQPFADQIAAAFAHVDEAFAEFTVDADAPLRRRIGHVVAALHHAACAQEAFYAVRDRLPAFDGFWQLPNIPAATPSGTEQPVAPGVIHVPPGGHLDGFSVYVPEYYSAAQRWPVIIALHGAGGNGRDFLWSWVREASSFGYIVVAPTALSATWSPDEDVGLLETISWLNRQYHIATERVLLTGVSDGGTYTLLYGLLHPDIYRALAPLCGVLHPANAALGNLGRAHGMPIYLVHGALDFLFPVERARAERDELLQAGAALEYRELPDLSHTYPRSENERILRWFAALPPRAG